MTDPASIKIRICKHIDHLAPQLIRLSRAIHAQPELAFEEKGAVRRLCSFLDEHGFSCRSGVGEMPTAFLAEYPPQATRRPAITFLAEYDALPDLGHACGHNLIAAASVGAAVGISSCFDKHWGRLVVLGTPAEEGGGGKIRLINKGVLEGLDVALMFHPDSETRLVKRSLAMVALEARFHGRAAHAAAAPHEGRNALDGVILAFNNINALRQQLREDARIHGIITHGGAAPNIIPDFAAARFMVRALDMAYLEQLREGVADCLQAAAQASRTRLELKQDELTYASFKPNYRLAELFRQNLKYLGLEEDPGSELANIGSSDVGNVSRLLPTLHPNIAICPPNISIHTPAFAEAAASELGQERMILAAKALALTALDIFCHPEWLEEAKQGVDPTH
jgi:amidohydrolase